MNSNLNNIQVNHALHLAGGTVEAVYGDTITFIGGGHGPDGPGGADFANPNDTIYVDAPIDEIYDNDDGTWTVVDEDGEIYIVTPDDGGTLIVDPDGNGFVIIDGVAYPVTVDPDDDEGGAGGGGAGGGTGGTIVTNSICEPEIEFTPGGSLHTYGFDTYKDNLPPSTYHSITVGEQTLHLPWKSVATGGSDRIFATPVGDTTITFAYQAGMPVNASSNEERYTLWTGSPPAGEDNLLAICSIDSTDNASVAGGVRVKSYDLTRHHVAVVPIGSHQPNFTEQQLLSALNSIYAQAVIDWDVSILSPLEGAYFEWLSGGIEVGQTDYSEDMREVWRTFVMLQNATPGTTYLFIIPGFKDNQGMTGYMPLKSGYGFLTPQATTHDAAHELGHGVFNLRHTFSQHNIFTLPQGTTQNLMLSDARQRQGNSRSLYRRQN